MIKGLNTTINKIYSKKRNLSATHLLFTKNVIQWFVNHADFNKKKWRYKKSSIQNEQRFQYQWARMGLLRSSYTSLRRTGSCLAQHKPFDKMLRAALLADLSKKKSQLSLRLFVGPDGLEPSTT